MSRLNIFIIFNKKLRLDLRLKSSIPFCGISHEGWRWNDSGMFTHRNSTSKSLIFMRFHGAVTLKTWRPVCFFHLVVTITFPYWRWLINLWHSIHDSKCEFLAWYYSALLKISTLIGCYKSRDSFKPIKGHYFSVAQLCLANICLWHLIRLHKMLQ